jgi:hypothetical protein
MTISVPWSGISALADHCSHLRMPNPACSLNNIDQHSMLAFGLIQLTLLISNQDKDESTKQKFLTQEMIDAIAEAHLDASYKELQRLKKVL